VGTGGKLGWNCQTCGMFSDENETKEDTLLEKLIAMAEKGNAKQEEMICEFCDMEKTELSYCKDCRMVICSKCKYGHKKSPVSKNHDIVNIEHLTSIKGDVIDEVIFCTKHDSNMVETFCETCNELLCKLCINDHYRHVIQTAEKALNNKVTDMEDCMKNITTKLVTTSRQVEAIDEEILNLQETYAKWRIDSDRKLEMLINRKQQKTYWMNK
jgi:hypothetical protein